MASDTDDIFNEAGRWTLKFFAYAVPIGLAVWAACHFFTV
jgi:hypothetical protein